MSQQNETEPMDLRQKTLSGVLWSVVEKWGGKTFSLLTFLLLARLLEPEVFGLIALATVFTALVRVFVDQGFIEAIVQRDDLEDGHLDTAFWANLGIGAVMTIGGISAAGAIASFFQEPLLEPVIRWLSLVFILTGLSAVQMALYRRSMSFKILATRTMIANIAGGIVGIGMALADFGVWSLVGQTLTITLAEVVVLWTASSWRPGFQVSVAHFMALWRFGIHVIGINLLNFVIRKSDDLLIGTFLGSTALGYYSVAYRILTSVTDLITNVTSRVAFSTFSRMQSDPSRLLNAYFKLTQYTSLVAFPVFLGLAILAPQLIPLVLGDAWGPSIVVMQVLSFVGLLQSVTHFNGSMLMGIGRPALMLMLSAASAVANVAAFLIAVQWGIVAVAIAYVIRTYLFFPIGPLLLRRLIGLRFGMYLQQFLIPLLASVIAAGTAFLVREFFLMDGWGVWNLMLEIVAGAVAYLITLMALARPVLREAWGQLTDLRLSAGSFL